MSKKELIIGAVIAALLISLGVAHVITRSPEPEEPVTGTSGGDIDYAVDEGKSTIEKVRERKAAEAREKALAAIEEHERILAADWAAPETPDRLMAVGNLYQYQLDEYDSAIQRYSTITTEHPRHTQTPWAYIEMAKCYERKGDAGQANYVYREMVEKLDPESEHVAYAKQRLGEM